MSSAIVKSVTLLFGAILVIASFTLLSQANTPSEPASPLLPQTDQAGAALQQGRRLLKRGHTDQALIQLQTALNLYTAAKNNRGMAAAQNELGDLYMRQGQYQVAIDHYQKALDGFMGAARNPDVINAAVGLADDGFNANLMLAKIGDVNFRLGRIPEATAAYGRMVVKKPESATTKVSRRIGLG